SVLKHFNVLSAKSYYINKGNKIDPLEIVKQTGLPCFVKPNRSGSSYGVSKVNYVEDLPAAIEKAFTEDSEILVESALTGVEVGVGVYNQRDKIIALPPTEIVSKNEF